MLETGSRGGGIQAAMTLLNKTGWEIAAAAMALAALGGAASWILFRRRPTAEEIEASRRKTLVQFGRLVDGMLLDASEVAAGEGAMLKMLFFSYRIGGVDYECSQDVTALGDAVRLERVRGGFPCSVRYQPGNPQNSIVVAEGWSGLRDRLPHYPAFDDPEGIDVSHLRHGVN